MNTYYKRLGEMNESILNAGNATYCKTPAVIRKAVSEYIQKELLHRDIIQEFQVLKAG